MKNSSNLKRVKDSLFITFVVVMALVVIGTIGAIASAGNNYDSSIMTNAKEVRFVNPLENTEVVKDFSSTKLQFNSTLKQWEAHKAVDLKAEIGDDVFSVANGKVKSIETTNNLGTIVEIEHNNGFVSKYASLNENVNVKVGDTVKAGDSIGTVDNSAKGETKDGVHLHFELLKDSKKVDPNLYFTFGQK